MNEMYLDLGDPSHDGHGQSDKLLFLVNKTVEEVQQGYKDSCKLTQVSFNHSGDYTGRDIKNYTEAARYQICTEYQNAEVSEEVLDILEEFDFPMIKAFRQEPYLCVDDFATVWFLFVRLSIPDLQWERKTVDDNIPTINEGNLNIQLGYGLYD